MHRYDRRRRLLGFAIAGLAGFVDAAGFLAADRYFVSFMSGNTTRLGVDLIASRANWIVPALLILGFVCGVMIGALVADWADRWRKTAVIGLSTILLACGAIGRLLGSDTIFIAGAVLAMGALNNSFRRDGEVAVGLTYMTGALVRFGQGLAACLRGKAQPGWLTNLALWASLTLGVIGGAAATMLMPAFAPWLILSLSLALCLSAFLLERQSS